MKREIVVGGVRLTAKQDTLYNIIGLVGPIASGKTSMVKHMVENCGAFSLRFSYPLEQILEILCLSKTRSNYQDLATALRGPFGSGVLVNVLEQQIVREKENHPFVIVDGIRMFEETEMIKKYGSLIYITASPEFRYNLLKGRKEKEGENFISFEEFLEQERKAPELLIHQIGKGLADFMIIDEGDLESLCKVIDEMLRIFYYKTEEDF